MICLWDRCTTQAEHKSVTGLAHYGTLWYLQNAPGLVGGKRKEKLQQFLLFVSPFATAEW